MADSSKTEKATPKKREDERKKGNIFQSSDVVSAFSILAIFVVLKLVLNNGVSVLLSSILASLFGLSLEMKKERKEEQTVHES